MKHQQVVVNYWNMIKASFTCLLLAFSGYILIKMVQTIFWLPAYLQKNQKRLEELASQYSVELNADKSNGIDVKAPYEDTNGEERQPLLKQQRDVSAAQAINEVLEPKKHK
ncbi:uncharacterized protein [Eurosta solidaginis]|uniref:uncharacterized protein n=1 Tax=Eurosta solidaginis TaxID=178769 RepID=UPI00353143F7